MDLHDSRKRADGREAARATDALGGSGALAWALVAIHTARWPVRLAFGAAAGLAGAVLRLVFHGVIPDQFVYLTFYPGVAVAALFGGFVPGAGAVLVSLLTAPFWSAPAATLDFVLRLVGFLLYSVAVCGLAEAMHRATWRLGEAEGRRADAERLLFASERFRLTESAHAIAAFDLDIEKNAAADVDGFRRMLGLAPETVVNREAMLSVARPDDVPKIKAALSAAFNPRGDGLYQAEYRIRRADDGAQRWIAARGHVYFEASRPVRMIGVCSDVTDAKTAERALQNSQAQVRMFVEQAPISIAMFDRDMIYVAASRRWIEAYGRGRESLAGLSHYELHPDIPDRWKAIHRGVLKGEFHRDADDYWTDADGREHWVRWATYPWTDAAGEIGGLIISAEEISAQKRAEAALRESEEKFRNAFADAAVGFAMAQSGGAILEANDAYCRLTGYTADELKSMRLVDLIHPDDRADNLALIHRMRAGQIQGYVVENRYLRKDGETIWVRKSVSMTRHAAGKLPWVVNLVEDVTARKRSQDTAARTVAQLTAVLDGAKDAIIAIDIKGIVQSINAAGERMFGYERGEVVGRNLRMLMPASHARRHNDYIGNYLRTGDAKMIGVGRETEGRRKDGSQFPIDLAVVEAAVYDELIFVGFVRDLSERRRIETRIDQLSAQRLTAIGGMAGALAHELNQPLAAVGFYLETARRMLGRPPNERPASVEDTLEQAGEQVARMGGIIRHLREFVAHGEPDKTHQSLHGLIREIASIEFPDDGRSGADLTLTLNAAADGVLMDRIQVGQVLSNLLRNAREAMADSPGSRVLISTRRSGDMIRCDVSDNGPGLADAVRGRLFEPLTSTKATGMGIGLSISKSIVEAHYGRIWAEPNPHGGSVFSFVLPLTTAGSEE